MENINIVLKHILTESQEQIYPEDLIKRDPKFDYTFVFGKVRKVHTICGLRRIGKTYYMYQIRKNLIEKKIPKESTFYINMEDERIPAETKVLTKLIPTIVENFHVKDQLYLFIDEIHRIPLWSSWARRIHDSRKAILFISGSTSKLSGEKIPSALRGRSVNLRLLPLSFRDFLKFRNVKIEEKYIEWSEDRLSLLKNYLVEYLRFGGLPEVVLTPKFKKLTLAQEYFRTIISRDIVDQFKVENKTALEDLLKISINTPTFSISKAHNVLKSMGHKIGKETIKKYVSYAQDAYFLDLITIFSKNIKDQMLYPRKAYIADNSFITALGIKYDMGRLLENLVYIELNRLAQKDPLLRIHYWKNKNGQEVDFIILRGLNIINLIQVCWDPTDPNTRKREIKSLIKAGDEFNLKEGTVVTYDYENTEKSGKFSVKFVPIWKILLGLEKLLK